MFVEDFARAFLHDDPGRLTDRTGGAGELGQGVTNTDLSRLWRCPEVQLLPTPCAQLGRVLKAGALAVPHLCGLETELPEQDRRSQGQGLPGYPSLATPEKPQSRPHPTPRPKPPAASHGWPTNPDHLQGYPIVLGFCSEGRVGP